MLSKSIYGKVDPKLVALAALVRPCSTCNDHACELARIILYAAGYVCDGLDSRNLYVWKRTT